MTTINNSCIALNIEPCFGCSNPLPPCECFIITFIRWCSIYATTSTNKIFIQRIKPHNGWHHYFCQAIKIARPADYDNLMKLLVLM